MKNRTMLRLCCALAILGASTGCLPVNDDSDDDKLAALLAGNANAAPTPPAAPKAWGTNVLLETDDATPPDHDAASQQVAISADGTVIAVWAQHDGSDMSIYANRYNGTAWSGRILLEAAGNNASDPQIAMDDSGRAIAVWSQSDGAQESIYYNRFNGTAWEGATAIENVATSAAYPQIAMNATGQAIAVWCQMDSGLAVFDIVYRRFDGANWGAFAAVANKLDSLPNNAQSPQIAINVSGQAVAVWYQADGTNDIFANYFDGANWAGADKIETDDTGQALYPQVAIDASGRAVAVWHQNVGAIDSIFANHFDGAVWTGATLIEGSDGLAQCPQVAMDSSGRAIAVWQQATGPRYDIYYNILSAGAWDGPNLLENDDAGYAVDAQIAMAPDGQAMAVWKQVNGGLENAMARRFDGTAWDAVVGIENNLTESSCSPQVSINASGQAAAVWYSDNTITSAWANLFR